MNYNLPDNWARLDESFINYKENHNQLICDMCHKPDFCCDCD
jgi:hypothetical protein